MFLAIQPGCLPSQELRPCDETTLHHPSRPLTPWPLPCQGSGLGLRFAAFAAHLATCCHILAAILPLLPPSHSRQPRQSPWNADFREKCARNNFKKRQKRQCSPRRSTLPASPTRFQPPTC